MARVKVCYASIELSDSVRITAAQFRGYVGYMFMEDAEFHHHMANSYHYPLVQYKKIGSKLVAMGLGDYADILYRKITDLQGIAVRGGSAKVTGIELRREEADIEEAERKYRFLTPWLALNEENYRRFMEASIDQRTALLKKVLTGNLLSMLKGLGIFITYKLVVSPRDAKPSPVRVNNNTFLGFKLAFGANISIPRYIGLGKSVSKGFGIVDSA